MSYTFPQGFQITSSEPIDTRLVLTKAEMLNMKKPNMPSVYFCICADDNEFYIYNKLNDVDINTGRFRKLEIAQTSIDGGNIADLENSTTYSLKRGTAEAWTEQNPILKEGELGYEIDSNQIKIGDGIHCWNDLLYLTSNFNNEEVEMIPTDKIQSLFNEKENENNG